MVELPECQLNLAQAVTYLATAPKSNATFEEEEVFEEMDDWREEQSKIGAGCGGGGRAGRTCDASIDCLDVLALNCLPLGTD